jgi:biopolymer transport protein ExbD
MGQNIRKIPEINAGSMADIAFLLLIFFLVTTTMDADKGINRKLPPWDDQPQTQQNLIKQKNVFEVLINSNNQLLVENEYMELDGVRQAAMEFIINNGDGTCDFCDKGLRDPNSSDNPTKAIVSLQNDRGTSYDIYIRVQNELVAAYEDLRNEYAMKRYGKKYTELSDAALIDEIKTLFPQNISEAEPIDLGGK